MDDGTVKEGIFKHKESRKAHVLIDERYIHVNLGDIEQSLTNILDTHDLDERIKERETMAVLAKGKSDYIKKNQIFRLTESMGEKRIRSPSPEIKVFEKKITKQQQERLDFIKNSYKNEDGEGIDISETLNTLKRHHGDEIGPEILKLG